MKLPRSSVLVLVCLLAACTVTGALASPPPSAPPAIPSKVPSPSATRAEVDSSAIAPPAATPTGSPASLTSIVVDHQSVDLFGEIPDAYLDAAASLRMVFVDRSVGLNISDGLNCLSSPSDEQARAACRVRDHTDPTYDVDADELDWSRPGGYDRSRWVFQPWPASGCGSWGEEVACYLQLAESLIPGYDVLSYQFSYLEVAPGSDIADPSAGFFADHPDRMGIGDLERLEREHPDKVFLYWTTSLARAIGSEEARAFNEQMRQYALTHGKPLFDVADILSHDPAGNPCFDNRDGVAYRDENHPDDGLNLPAICPHYTTESEGGHLGRVSVGAIRVAKAFWVLMAQVAGWEP